MEGGQLHLRHCRSRHQLLQIARPLRPSNSGSVCAMFWQPGSEDVSPAEDELSHSGQHSAADGAVLRNVDAMGSGQRMEAMGGERMGLGPVASANRGGNGGGAGLRGGQPVPAPRAQQQQQQPRVVEGQPQPNGPSSAPPSGGGLVAAVTAAVPKPRKSGGPAKPRVSAAAKRSRVATAAEYAAMNPNMAMGETVQAPRKQIRLHESEVFTRMQQCERQIDESLRLLRIEYNATRASPKTASLTPRIPKTLHLKVNTGLKHSRDEPTAPALPSKWSLRISGKILPRTDTRAGHVPKIQQEHGKNWRRLSDIVERVVVVVDSKQHRAEPMVEWSRPSNPTSMLTDGSQWGPLAAEATAAGGGGMSGGLNCAGGASNLGRGNGGDAAGGKQQQHQQDDDESERKLYPYQAHSGVSPDARTAGVGYGHHASAPPPVAEGNGSTTAGKPTHSPLSV
eukprot:COSAG05_NODE_602_length_8420_cov_13.540199_3_plen_452_part_00